MGRGRGIDELLNEADRTANTEQREKKMQEKMTAMEEERAAEMQQKLAALQEQAKAEQAKMQLAVEEKMAAELLANERAQKHEAMAELALLKAQLAQAKRDQETVSQEVPLPFPTLTPLTPVPHLPPVPPLPPLSSLSPSHSIPLVPERKDTALKTTGSSLTNDNCLENSSRHTL
jgi:hypothetical protein